MMPETAPKHPETALLALTAMKATDSKTAEEFLALTGGAISLRTFRYWLAGARPVGGVERLVLDQMIKGWRPKL